MKQLILVLFVLVSMQAFTQKKGVIIYSVTSEAQDTSYQSVMSAALLSKSTFSFIFSRKRKARVQLRAGTFFNFVTVFDHKKGKFMRLLSNQDAKTAEFGDIVKLPDSLQNLQSTYTLLEDTKTILGFHCKKATFETEFGELSCWYTDELDHNFKKLEFIDIDVPGFPLMFMTVSGKVTMTYQATSFEKITKEYRAFLKLETPEGYTEVGTP